MVGTDGGPSGRGERRTAAHATIAASSPIVVAAAIPATATSASAPTTSSSGLSASASASASASGSGSGSGSASAPPAAPSKAARPSRTNSTGYPAAHGN